MKKLHEDLYWDIPYLDRSVIDDKTVIMTPEQKQWREYGFVVLPEKVPSVILDAFKNNLGIYADIATFNPILKMSTDLVGDEMKPRGLSMPMSDPPFYHYWMCTAYVALRPNSELEFIPQSHKNMVGTEVGNGKPVRWDAQEGDIILLHVCLDHRGSSGLLPVYLEALQYKESKHDLRLDIHKGWKRVKNIL